MALRSHRGYHSRDYRQSIPCSGTELFTRWAGETHALVATGSIRGQSRWASELSTCTSSPATARSDTTAERARPRSWCMWNVTSDLVCRRRYCRPSCWTECAGRRAIVTVSDLSIPASSPSPTNSRSTTLTMCRLCRSTELRSFLDLGATPPCELFLTADAVEAPEATYPLHVRVCEQCLLAQLPPLITPEETFTEYAYFSSFSTSWVQHARHVRRRARCERLGARDRTRSSSRWPATTATCCSTWSGAGSGAWVSSRR